MNATDDLEHRLRSWMSATAPEREPAGLVERAVRGTEQVAQRPGFLVRMSAIDRPWNPLPGLTPAARLTIVLLAALAVVTASLAVGSRLLRPPTELPSDAVAPPTRTVLTVTGQLVTRRAGHTATLLPDGRVLVAGGTDGLGTSLATAEIWDPVTGEFEPTGSMTTARDSHAAALLADGRVLILGGNLRRADGTGIEGGLATAEVFDPDTGSFSATGAMAVERGTGIRGDFLAAATLADGEIFVTGGDLPSRRDPTGGFLPVLDVPADIYDPASSRFRQTRDIPCAAAGSATRQLDGPAQSLTARTATRLLDGSVLITCLGFDVNRDHSDTGRAAIYDPGSDTFTATGSPTTAGLSAALLSDGRVLLGGPSLPPGGAISTPNDLVDVFDPADGSFTMIQLPGWVRGHIVAIEDGRALVVGDLGVEVLDPTAGSLEPVGGVTQRLGRTASATVLADGRVLIAGGRTTGDRAAPTVIVDPRAMPR